jgi:RNA polymerase sigma-70 factor (ECF subfamily)
MGPAYRFGRGFCRDEHDAQDIVQEVLASLVRSLRTFRGDASLSTWAYVVARNACGRRRRREATRSRREASLDSGPGVESVARAVPDPGDGPERHMEARETREILDRSLRRLPVPQREVLILRDVEGLSAPEVGRILGLGERAVKSRLHRARVALRAMLAPYLRDGSAAAAGSGRCPDTALLLSRHLEEDLDAKTCARLEAHVESCAACDAACETLLAALRECRRCRAATLPPAVREAVRDAARKFVAGRRATA